MGHVGSIGLREVLPDEQRESLLAGQEYSDDTARIIDEEIKRLVDHAYAEAQRILDENWDKVEAVARALLRHETLNSDDIDTLMKGGQIDRPTVADMLQRKWKHRSLKKAQRHRPVKMKAIFRMMVNAARLSLIPRSSFRRKMWW